ncbi:hypothetical protein E2542_SST00561 [Spatholobus suberectus]|nr:hypothetical protein E2542_SST00561 [Spatholobus suberectus]
MPPKSTTHDVDDAIQTITDKLGSLQSQLNTAQQSMDSMRLSRVSCTPSWTNFPHSSCPIKPNPPDFGFGDNWETSIILVER